MDAGKVGTGKTCPDCGSAQLTALIEWPETVAPPGIFGFIYCEACDRWEARQAITHSDDIFDHARWATAPVQRGHQHTPHHPHQAGP